MKFQIFILWNVVIVAVRTLPILDEDMRLKGNMHGNSFRDEKLTPRSLRTALREFQKYIILRPDGMLTVKNYSKKTRRCGLRRITLALKDLESNDSYSRSGRKPCPVRKRLCSETNNQHRSLTKGITLLLELDRF